MLGKHPAWAACWSLLRILTLEQRRIVFVHLDEFDQALNAEVGERQDAVFSDARDLDDAVLDFHLAGDVPQPVFVFTELLDDAIAGSSPYGTELKIRTFMSSSFILRLIARRSSNRIEPATRTSGFVAAAFFRSSVK